MDLMNFLAQFTVNLSVDANPAGRTIADSKDIFSFGISTNLLEEPFTRKAHDIKPIACHLHILTKTLTYKVIQEEIIAKNTDFALEQEQLVEFCKAHSSQFPVGRMVHLLLKEGSEIFTVSVMLVNPARQMTVWRDRKMEPGLVGGLGKGIFFILPNTVNLFATSLHRQSIH